MQKSNKKYIIYAATFVLCLIMGFGLTRLLSPRAVKEQELIVEPVPAPEPVKEYFSYTNSIVRRETHKGLLRGSKSDTVMDVEYKTHYTGYTLDGDTLEKQAETTVTRKIVKILENPKPAIEPAPIQVPKEMTQEQFSAMLNGLDEKLVGRGIAIRADKLKAGDRKIRNVTDVHDAISTHNWSKVKVISLNYDEQTGKVKSAVVEPVYPTE